MSEFIYVLENPSMSGIVKIGRTDRDVSQRASELSSHTGVPTDFVVVKAYAVTNAIEAEKRIHERLSEYRVSENREFFRIESDDAALIIENLLELQRQDGRRDFEQEDALIALALPAILKLGTVRPRVLEEMLGISYEEALFVIWALRARGMLNERNELIGSWKMEHERILNLKEKHSELVKQVKQILANLRDPETNEPVEIEFDYGSENLGVNVRGSEWVKSEAQRRLAEFSQSYAQSTDNIAEVVSAPAAPPKLVQSPPKKPKPIAVASTPLIGNYQLPPMDFLQHPDLTTMPTESKKQLMANARLLQQTLAQFEIEVSLGDITKGPTITRYELHPAPGVRLEEISALSSNLAAALKAECINILTPVPGKSSVGVEVPNSVRTKVIVRDLFESGEWRNCKAKIPIALGKDIYGHPIVADLSKMPHLLIAGSTGSGKSICINTIIASLLYKFSPDQVRFVMIDPRIIELQQYNALPHLIVPVTTDPQKTILALRWVVNEMEKRYLIFARVGAWNIGSFNSRPNKKLVPQEPKLPLTAKKEKVEPGAEGFAVEVDEEIVVPHEEDIVIPEKLSYVVVIIENFDDLMRAAPADVEAAIGYITQKSHAAGIHCILSTQRPSASVISEHVKNNIPARIAFQCASRTESREILGEAGAEKLFGKGDMLYLPADSPKLIRAQGALITDMEISGIIEFIARQGRPNYDLEIHKQLSQPAASFGNETGIDEDEELIQQCIEAIRSEQKASVSLMQRRLRLGYTRAARIMDELESRGIVGPSKGAEPRDILIDLDGGGADGGGQEAV